MKRKGDLQCFSTAASVRPCLTPANHYALLSLPTYPIAQLLGESLAWCEADSFADYPNHSQYFFPRVLFPYSNVDSLPSNRKRGPPFLGSLGDKVKRLCK